MAKKRSDRNRRIRKWLDTVPPSPWSSGYDPIASAHLKRLAEMDLSVTLQMKEIMKRLPAFVASRMNGGSGSRMARLLRSFLLEYVDRSYRHGPDLLPLSFNSVVEFLDFNEKYFAFDLLEEREHALELHRFLNWYEGDVQKRIPALALSDIIPENVIHSYDFYENEVSFRLKTKSSEIIIVGVSVVRDGPLISVALLAGESPPDPLDEEIEKSTYEAGPGKDGLKPSDEYSLSARYLEGYDGYSKVILLSRFDVRHSTFDVRYVLLDTGANYVILTDDPEFGSSLPSGIGDSLMATARENLVKYNGLFSLAASLIYLPALFVSMSESVVSHEVVTELAALKGMAARRIRDVVGGSEFLTRRTIGFLVKPVSETASTSSRSIAMEPPDLELASSGFWKPLSPGEIGKDADGNAVLGRTWVERHERWAAAKLSAFVGTLNMNPPITGPDPGFVYIVRSPSHGPNVYKVGLTRRNVALRARELGGDTGVPMPFQILAEFQVGDCTTVERAVHARLANVRLNPKREFFCADLRFIIKTVQEILDELDNR